MSIERRIRRLELALAAALEKGTHGEAATPGAAARAELVIYKPGDDLTALRARYAARGDVILYLMPDNGRDDLAPPELAHEHS